MASHKLRSQVMFWAAVAGIASLFVACISAYLDHPFLASKQVTLQPASGSGPVPHFEILDPPPGSPIGLRVLIAGRTPFPADHHEVFVESAVATPLLQNTEVHTSPDGSLTFWADLGNAVVGIGEEYLIQLRHPPAGPHPEAWSNTIHVMRTR